MGARGETVEVKTVEEAACPECGSTHLVRDYQRGEILCDSCGLVISENIIDQGPEWREHSDDDTSPSRVGAPMSYTLHDKGLSTEIPIATRDVHGRPIPNEAKERFFRMRRLHKQVTVSRAGERSLAEALRELARMAALLQLPPNLREEASLIYRKAALAGIVRGRSIEAIASASLYMVCRLNGVPRTLEEIAAVLGVDRKKIGKAYRAMSRALIVRAPSPRPTDYIERFCNELKLGRKAQAKVYEILRELADRDQSSSSTPNGIAAAAIYLASVLCNERRSQREIARVATVSEVTLRNRARYIVKRLNIDFSAPKGRGPA